MKLVAELGREEVKERFVLSAFVGWQMGAGGDKKFGEYLEGLGLAEKPVAETTPESRGLTAKAAIAKAEEILAMARKKAEKPTVPCEQDNNDIVGSTA